MRILAFVVVIFLGISASATPVRSDSIDFDNFEVAYLEQLVKEKIDSVRQGLGLTSLKNDEVLYKAAKDQAQYLKNRNQVGHFQASGSKRTAFDRAEYYGAENLKVVGENVVWNFLERFVSIDPKTGKISSDFEYTYDSLANDLLRSWIESHTHYENVQSNEYYYTGLAIIYDESNKELMCVQVFADYFP